MLNRILWRSCITFLNRIEEITKFIWCDSVLSSSNLWLIFFQGLYVFSVYFIMHSQVFWPAKATYTVEMNGHGSPDSMYQSTGAATVGGGEISKSTQNLISAMEEVRLLLRVSINVSNDQLLLMLYFAVASDSFSLHTYTCNITLVAFRCVFA